VISDVVIVPAAPLLLPEYQGRAAAVPGLLESCVAVLGEAVASAHHVVVVHATDREPRSTRPAIGLRVADHLLAATHEDFDVEHVPVAWYASVDECLTLGRALETGSRTTLLVVGDGSARRTEKAPGHLDPRAAGVDDEIVAAIAAAAEAGLDRLLELDPQLCADLLVAGRAPFQVLAAATGGGRQGERTAYEVVDLEVSDPLGVLYVVAHLRARP
jgi:hypothetical protein